MKYFFCFLLTATPSLIATAQEAIKFSDKEMTQIAEKIADGLKLKVDDVQGCLEQFNDSTLAFEEIESCARYSKETAQCDHLTELAARFPVANACTQLAKAASEKLSRACDFIENPGTPKPVMFRAAQTLSNGIIKTASLVWAMRILYLYVALPLWEYC